MAEKKKKKKKKKKKNRTRSPPHYCSLVSLWDFYKKYRTPPHYCFQLVSLWDFFMHDTEEGRQSFSEKKKKESVLNFKQYFAEWDTDSDENSSDDNANVLGGECLFLFYFFFKHKIVCVVFNIYIYIYIYISLHIIF